MFEEGVVPSSCAVTRSFSAPRRSSWAARRRKRLKAAELNEGGWGRANHNGGAQFFYAERLSRKRRKKAEHRGSPLYFPPD